MRVGINLPQYAVDFDGGACAFDGAADLARRAEAAGLDSVWVSDHFFVIAPDGSVCGALEGLSFAAALLRGTTRIRVGTLVLAATHRPPALVAHAARTMGERLTLGLGAGWHAGEHRAYDLPLPPYRDRIERLWETLGAVRALRRRPALLAGGASDALLDCAAAGADEWNVAWDVPPDAYRALARRADAACERAGRDPATLGRSVGLTVAIGDRRDRERQVERVRARAPYLRDLALDRLEGRICAGTVAECAERFAAYAEAGAREIVCTPLVRDDPGAPEALAAVRARLS